MRRFVIVPTAVALVLLGAAPAAAVPPATVAPTAVAGAAAYPAAAVCVDTVSVLGPAGCARVEAVLAQDEQRTTDEIAVAIVPTTGAASIEDWSTGLFNAWGVGQADQDNGVLLVLAMRDRALRIVTGDGLRARLPDGQASEIVGGTMLPLMRENRAEDAVLLGLDAVRTALGHDISGSALAAPGTRPYTPFSDDEPEEDSGSGQAWLWILLLVGVAVGGWVLSRLPSPDGGGGDDDGYTPRRSYSPRRSFSSSSSRRSSSRSSSRRSSFGGGRSSGGGASGRW